MIAKGDESIVLLVAFCFLLPIRAWGMLSNCITPSKHSETGAFFIVFEGVKDLPGGYFAELFDFARLHVIFVVFLLFVFPFCP